jgi:hypothetical protein
MRRRKQATKRLRRKMTKIARRDAQTVVRGPSIGPAMSVQKRTSALHKVMSDRGASQGELFGLLNLGLRHTV